MSDTIRVTGLSDLQKFLDDLPVKIEKNIIRSALRQGAKVIEAQVKANAPTAPANSENAKLYGGYAGALRDSIHVTTKVRGAWVTASVVAGGKNKKTGADVYYAHIIEFTGAKAHTITAKGMKSLSFGGLFFQSVQHPGMQKHPFMRPALDTQASAAVIAAAEHMKQRLATKEGLDTLAVLIEGDEP